MPIPNTCPEFVEHPHRVENAWGFCYQCGTSSASVEQGTSAIAEALIARGIPADVHQTGGFTMCVYIDLGEGSYIYANAEGASFYDGKEFPEGDSEAEILIYFEEEATLEEKAEALYWIIIEKNLLEVA